MDTIIPETHVICPTCGAKAKNNRGLRVHQRTNAVCYQRYLNGVYREQYMCKVASRSSMYLVAEELKSSGGTSLPNVAKHTNKKFGTSTYVASWLIQLIRMRAKCNYDLTTPNTFILKQGKMIQGQHEPVNVPQYVDVPLQHPVFSSADKVVGSTRSTHRWAMSEELREEYEKIKNDAGKQSVLLMMYQQEARFRIEEHLLLQKGVVMSAEEVAELRKRLACL